MSRRRFRLRASRANGSTKRRIGRIFATGYTPDMVIPPRTWLENRRHPSKRGGA